MDSWKKTHIYDYWDFRTGALEVFSEALRYTSELEPEKKQHVLNSIKEGVLSGVKQLSDSELMRMLVSMLDDVYKAGSSTERYDDAVFEYIAASAGTFADAAMTRGYQMHYLVDNSFEQTHFGMQRPLDLFPSWFAAAGVVYNCPQFLALKLMEADGVNRVDYIDALTRYIDEARYLSSSLIEQCHQQNKHYIYLDTDSVPGSFDLAMSLSGSPGIITVLRDDAPDMDSKIKVAFPSKSLL